MLPDDDGPPVSLHAPTSSARGPAKWAAVGVLAGASLVGLAWAVFGQPVPRSSAAPAPLAQEPSPAPAPSPIFVINVPPTPPASSTAPEPAVAEPVQAAGPPTRPPITVEPAAATTPPGPTPDPKPAADKPATDKPAGTRINLNTATLEELDLLPGVGKATAQAILDYRTKHGKFRTVSELDKVPGIGPSKLDRLRPLVKVD